MTGELTMKYFAIPVKTYNKIRLDIYKFNVFWILLLLRTLVTQNIIHIYVYKINIVL